MKVAYILNSTYSAGGASKSFMTMLEGVKRKGVSPVVVLPDTDGLYNDILRLGIPVIALTYRPDTYPYCRNLKDLLLFVPRLSARRFVNAMAVRKLTRIFMNEHIDMIHTNVSVIDIGFRTADLLNIPHIYHIREYGDLDFKEHYYPSWNIFHRRKIRDSYTICITRDIQKHHQLSNLSTSKVIYNGIGNYTADVLERSIDKEEYFLYVGRIEPAKGLLQLLEAYVMYRRKCLSGTVPLWIAGSVGDAEYGRLINEYVTSSHLADSVRFLGLRKDVDVLMQKAKAIVIPSRFEAFGRCMAEAMFNGCIVIGKNTGGTKEQFDNGLQLTGKEIGFRYNTTGELSDCLMKVLSLSLDEMKGMLVRAYQVVNRLYSGDAYVQQVYEFYKSIADEDNH